MELMGLPRDENSFEAIVFFVEEKELIHGVYHQQLCISCFSAPPVKLKHQWYIVQKITQYELGYLASKTKQPCFCRAWDKLYKTLKTWCWKVDVYQCSKHLSGLKRVLIFFKGVNSVFSLLIWFFSWLLCWKSSILLELILKGFGILPTLSGSTDFYCCYILMHFE